MSVKIMGQVWELKLSPSHRLVLLALADHADHDGDNIYPGVPLIAWKCGYSERQVQRILKELEDTGILVRMSSEPGRRVVYRIDVAKGTRKRPCNPRQNVTPDKMSPLTFATQTPDILTPTPDICDISTGSLPAPRAANPTPNHHEPSVEPSSSPRTDEKPKNQGGDDGDFLSTLVGDYGISKKKALEIMSTGVEPETCYQSIRNCHDPKDPNSMGRLINRLISAPPKPGKPYAGPFGKPATNGVSLTPPSPRPDAQSSMRALREQIERERRP